MVFFKTIKFRISKQELNAALVKVGLIINTKIVEKSEDLQAEWQVTLTQIDRK